jgi:hypothetical protein
MPADGGGVRGTVGGWLILEQLMTCLQKKTEAANAPNGLAKFSTSFVALAQEGSFSLFLSMCMSMKLTVEQFDFAVMLVSPTNEE